MNGKRELLCYVDFHCLGRGGFSSSSSNTQERGNLSAEICILVCYGSAKEEKKEEIFNILCLAIKEEAILLLDTR